MAKYWPTKKLADGNEIPMLGFGLGTANYKRTKSKELDQKVIDNTILALENGWYHLDCAEAYNNSVEVGVGLARAAVPRSQLFITTKTSCHAGETIAQSLERSLSELGVDYVDLFLLHSPYFGDGSAACLQSAWAEMEALQAAGKTRSIGVSNYLREHLAPVLETAKVVPAVNQIEYHPYLQHRPSEHDDLLAYMREKGIDAEAYSPLAAVAAAAPGPCDEVYARIAGRYGVLPEDVGMRWCLDQGVVAVTTSSRAERLRGYLERLPKFELTKAEIDEIAEAGKGKNFRGYWQHKFAADDWR